MVILDHEGALGDPVQVAVAALAGGADIIQVREKERSEAEVATLVETLLDAIGNQDRLSVNGLPTIAERFGTGLHLPEAMRADRATLTMRTGTCLSRSIHDAGDGEDADYLVLGNLCVTSSKPGKPGIGLESFEQIAAAYSQPVLAIGGITPDRVRGVLEHGGHGVVVRSWVIGSADPKRAACAIRTEIDRWSKSRNR